MHADNNLGPEGAKALAPALQAMTGLPALQAMTGLIENALASFGYNAMHATTGLKSLDLWGTLPL